MPRWKTVLLNEILCWWSQRSWLWIIWNVFREKRRKFFKMFWFSLCWLLMSTQFHMPLMMCKKGSFMIHQSWQIGKYFILRFGKSVHKYCIYMLRIKFPRTWEIDKMFSIDWRKSKARQTSSTFSSSLCFSLRLISWKTRRKDSSCMFSVFKAASSLTLHRSHIWISFIIIFATQFHFRFRSFHR